MTYKNNNSRPSPFAGSKDGGVPRQLSITGETPSSLPQNSRPDSSTSSRSKTSSFDATGKFSFREQPRNSGDKIALSHKPANAKSRQAKALSTQRGPAHAQMVPSCRQHHPALACIEEVQKVERYKRPENVRPGVENCAFVRTIRPFPPSLTPTAATFSVRRTGLTSNSSHLNTAECFLHPDPSSLETKTQPTQNHQAASPDHTSQTASRRRFRRKYEHSLCL